MEVTDMRAAFVVSPLGLGISPAFYEDEAPGVIDITVEFVSQVPFLYPGWCNQSDKVCTKSGLAARLCIQHYDLI